MSVKSAKKRKRKELALVKTEQQLPDTPLAERIKAIMEKDLLDADDERVLASVASTRTMQMQFLMLSYLRKKMGSSFLYEDGRKKLFESLLARISNLSNEEMLHALHLMNNLTSTEFNQVSQMIEMSKRTVSKEAEPKPVSKETEPLDSEAARVMDIVHELLKGAE